MTVPLIRVKYDFPKIGYSIVSIDKGVIVKRPGKLYFKCYVSIIFFLLSISLENVWAHDVIHEIQHGNAVIVNVGYESGEIMSYAEVTIFSPENKTIEYQYGRTDANGQFAFLPDAPGEWKIVVDDGNGHGFVANYTVDESMNVEIKQSLFNRIKKLFAGLLLLFGCTGFLYYLLARKKVAAQ